MVSPREEAVGMTHLANLAIRKIRKICAYFSRRYQDIYLKWRTLVDLGVYEMNADWVYPCHTIKCTKIVDVFTWYVLESCYD